MSKIPFLLDVPNGEDKFLIHTAIVNTLKEKILNLTLNECSFNIGLFGEWGSGKSFIVNKLEEELKVDSIRVFKFDAWKYNGKSLERSILFELEKQGFLIYGSYYEYDGKTLDQMLNSKVILNSQVKMDMDKIKKNFNKLTKTITWYSLGIFAYIIVKYIISLLSPSIRMFFNNDYMKLITKTLSNIAITFGIPTMFVSFIKGDFKNFFSSLIFKKEDVKEEILPTFSSEEFENIFNDMINVFTKEGKKILIVFDNIDRCEPEYAYKVISTIKTYMDLKGCVYLIPCDDEALKNYLVKNNYESKNRNYEQEFLDKVFQVNLRIPKLSGDNIDKYIGDCLSELYLPKLEQGNENIIKQILYFAYKGQTPRQIKRFLNDFAIYYSLANTLDEERNFLLDEIKIFTIIVAIKQRWPRLEEKLVEDSRFREKFYGDDREKQIIKELYNEELIEFLNNVSIWFNNNKPLLSYIYFMKQNDEVKIQEKLLSGSKIQTSILNYNIANNLFKSLKMDSQDLYLYNLYKSIFNIVYVNEGKYLFEFKCLFEDMTKTMINHNKDMIDFFGELTYEELKNFSNMKFNIQTINYLANGILNFFKEQNKFNTKELFEVILKSNCFWKDNLINDYFIQYKTNNKIVEFCEVIHKNFKMYDMINEKFYLELFNILIEYDGEKGDKIAQVLKHSSQIKYYINNHIKENYSELDYDIIRDDENKLGNLFYIINEVDNLEQVQDFIGNVLKYVDMQEITNKKIIFNYCICAFEWLDDNEKDEYYKKIIKDYMSDEDLVIESINLFDERYFIENIYDLSIIKNKYTGSNIKLIIDRLSNKFIKENFEMLIMNPIYVTELEVITNKFKDEVFDIKNNINKKFIYGLKVVYNKQDKNHQKDLVGEIRDSFNFILDQDIIDVNVFIGMKNIIKNLYVDYPQEMSNMVIYLMKNNKFGNNEMIFILTKIYNQLKETNNICKYEEFYKMYEILGKDINRENLSKLKVLIKELFNLGRNDEEYKLLYKLLSVYVSFKPLNIFKGELDLLISNGKEEFADFINAIEQTASDETNKD